MANSTSSRQVTVLNMNIKQNINELKQNIQNLKRLVFEHDGKRNTLNYVMGKLNEHEAICTALPGLLRKALVSSKISLAKREKTARETLMGTDPASLKARRMASTDVVQHSQDFTSSLERSRAILSAEIKRSEDALQNLANSTSTLESTADEYDKFSSALGAGKATVNKLTRRDYTDMVMIGLGVLCFLLTVLYILKKRIGYVLSLGWGWAWFWGSSSASVVKAAMADTGTADSIITEHMDL